MIKTKAVSLLYEDRFLFIEGQEMIVHLWH